MKLKKGRPVLSKNRVIMGVYINPVNLKNLKSEVKKNKVTTSAMLRGLS
ncbi:hypothetical protein AGMMS5026_05680 [Endomicrobiia bacterium]|nr:hypothetical protein [Candidatus Endomicrobium trichonymphae]GHT06787.1 hypothetical protein AGMMS49523_09360 [Endomicrobiia bacterium]GHT09377.1 hypothetical protein AGMMS49532_07210 [Endomicrobiia bacterium]GHT12878.1 hypothetical protein AGMMS49571_05610 [Endomicrobiia bacterium]GHT29240.1 hypothetical protein AGMMS49995_11240 [Endomicrobiia bacterium]GHT30728.1 hypothetical protein AGMMS5026_05680 [Endomicrobiia bacterium]